MSKLGGSISEMGAQFDPAATHVIAAKVSRSEKLLCSVASGRWVVHPSYLQVRRPSPRAQPWGFDFNLTEVCPEFQPFTFVLFTREIFSRFLGRKELFRGNSAGTE